LHSQSRTDLFIPKRLEPLITLPPTLKEFNSMYMKKKCELHNDLSSNLVICLLYGFSLCSGTCPKAKLINFFNPEGNINVHCKKVHHNMSIFLEVPSLKIMVTDTPDGFMLESRMYMDELGQGFYEARMSEGRVSGHEKEQLEKYVLNTVACEYLRKCVVQNRIAQEVYYAYLNEDPNFLGYAIAL